MNLQQGCQILAEVGQIGTNRGVFKSLCSVLSHFVPIWSIMGPNLPSLIYLLYIDYFKLFWSNLELISKLLYKMQRMKYSNANNNWIIMYLFSHNSNLSRINVHNALSAPFYPFYILNMNICLTFFPYD